jgi:multidrug transporter EmrE-like cation transporter
MIKTLLLISVSLFAVLGNSLLKMGASSGDDDELLKLSQIPRAALRPKIIAGALFYGISQLLWITVLRIADLSMAYPITIGLNFSFIMFVAWYHFKEPVSLGKLGGMSLIFAGVVTIAMG